MRGILTVPVKWEVCALGFGMLIIQWPEKQVLVLIASPLNLISLLQGRSGPKTHQTLAVLFSKGPGGLEVSETGLKNKAYGSGPQKVSPQPRVAASL